MQINYSNSTKKTLTLQIKIIYYNIKIYFIKRKSILRVRENMNSDIEKSKYAFEFQTMEQFKRGIENLEHDIPVEDVTEEGISLLKSKIILEGKKIPNRLCVQPMEGCDGNPDGSPGELTFRRYKRFAGGGSGLIWVEATAVTPEGKANPRQLMINEKSAYAFKKLANTIRSSSFDEEGRPQRPFTVLQITHSGRYSKPHGKPEPMIMHHSPVLDPTHGLSEDYPLVTDEYMDQLQDKYLAAAKLAYECGFDAVDIKSCHGYLLHEVLSAHTREGSKYAGSFENRTRFLTDTVKRIKTEIPGLIVTTRLNVFDAYPYPYGWGMKKDGSMEPDLSEPVMLIKELESLGVKLINICTGNPYFNPHIERPYDHPIQGFTVPDVNPLELIGRNIRITGEIARTFGNMVVAGTGYSWLRHISANVGLAMLKNKQCGVIGMGRLALAYPGFANELLKTGRISPEKTCITCSSCTQIMRDGGMSGCVIRDKEIYGPIYYRGRLKNREFIDEFAKSCYNCHGAPCKANCPAGMDIPGFIKLFHQGKTREAYELMREKNILPETCAYTCPVEELCEKDCTAGILGGKSVPIHEIQKFIAVEARENGWTETKAGVPNGKKVAVIGFGPAGIACSTRLVEKGVGVSVFEAAETMGGAASAVIPFDRLPDKVIQNETGSLGLEKTGLFEIRYNKRLDEQFDIGCIEKDGYDAVFIAVGMIESTELFGGERPKGVYSAMDFLFNIKRGSFTVKPDDRAAVIGGGNTAMDAAVSLKRAGVKDVYVLYRRSYKDLPAWQHEVNRALEEGVHLLLFNQPSGYTKHRGSLTGIKLLRTIPGRVDSSGRPEPVPLKGSEYVLPVSICIEATGQKVPDSLVKSMKGVEFDMGRIRISNGKYGTTRKKVFAGGDIVNGGKTVVQAVKEGMEAADEIYEALMKN